MKNSGRPRNPAVESQILDTTLRLLAEQGFSRMSIDAVALAAGVSKPTIYRRWKDKADLATAALACFQLNEPPIEGPTAIAKLRVALRNFRRSLLRPNGPALVGMVLAEEHHTPELLHFFRERIVAPRRRIVANLLQEAVQSGELSPKTDIEAAATMLIGSFYARYLAGDEIPEAWVDRIVNTLLA